MKVMEEISKSEMKSIGFDFFTHQFNSVPDITGSLYTRRGIVITIPYEGKGKTTIANGYSYEQALFNGSIKDLEELKSKLKELNISYDGDN